MAAGHDDRRVTNRDAGPSGRARSLGHGAKGSRTCCGRTKAPPLPRSGREAPAIEARGLVMRYGDREVLHGIDLVVPHGTVMGFLGPNGAGKTTTVEILEGYRRRTAGHASVLGMDPASGCGGGELRGLGSASCSGGRPQTRR